jgi:hypothetical protein
MNIPATVAWLKVFGIHVTQEMIEDTPDQKKLVRQLIQAAFKEKKHDHP